MILKTKITPVKVNNAFSTRLHCHSLSQKLKTTLGGLQGDCRAPKKQIKDVVDFQEIISLSITIYYTRVMSRKAIFRTFLSVLPPVNLHGMSFTWGPIPIIRGKYTYSPSRTLPLWFRYKWPCNTYSWHNTGKLNLYLNKYETSHLS